MTRKSENDLYRAYCNLCKYTNQIPLRKSKWKIKNNSTPTKHNRTVEDIRKELDEMREHI